MQEHGIYTKEGASLIKRALNASTEKGALVFFYLDRWLFR